MTLTPGTLLNDRYRIVSILGQGGMGSVYRAIDERLSVSVAVKENLFLSEEYTRQFDREAKILASLRHPHLPRVGDYFRLPGKGQYLIMDYIEGEDLRQRIERIGALDERDVVLIGSMVSDALTYLHTRKPPIIHRDIKPGNIKITPEGEAFLVDFGLAKVSLGAQATITGARAMTPGYSPPEQYGMARTDSRSDVYSLGATLYAALSGAIPEDGLERLTSKATLTSLTEHKPAMKQKLASVIEKAMAIEAEDRFQTAEEFKKNILEAGEMTHVMPQKVAITPPPLEESDVLDIPEVYQSDLYNTGGSHTSITQRRKFAWIPVVLLAILGVLLIAMAFWGQDQPVVAMMNNKTATVASSTVVVSPGGVDYFTATLDPVIAEMTETQVVYVDSETPAVTLTAQEISASKTPSPVQGESTVVSATQSPVAVPTMIGGSEEIIFSSNRTGIMQIWSLDLKTNFQRQLTSMEFGACSPAWSPDGQQIAFISPCEAKRDYYEGTEIYIMNADESNLHRMPVPPSPEGDYFPAWSPDGKRIAFTSLRSGVSHIFLYDLENETISELSNTPHVDKNPAWNPSGKQLVFSRQTYSSQLWLVSDNGRFSSQFTLSGQFNNFTPVWSPDGEFIMYCQTELNGSIPWLVKMDYEDRGTSRESRVKPVDWIGSLPLADVDISPDGKWIVFESWPDGRNHDIYLMSVEGKDLTRLTTDPDFDFNPDWRPINP